MDSQSCMGSERYRLLQLTILPRLSSVLQRLSFEYRLLESETVSWLSILANGIHKERWGVNFDPYLQSAGGSKICLWAVFYTCGRGLLLTLIAYVEHVLKATQ
jgi:hypothetical protein